MLGAISGVASPYSFAGTGGVGTRETKAAATTQNAARDQEVARAIQDLSATDRAVRSHEQAHLAAAGRYATSAPSYEYSRGPDGNFYAVGGEVSIDTSPVEGDPEGTIQKAQTVRAAALAPSEPSSQDRSVAAAASQMEAKASAELVAFQRKLLDRYTDSKPQEGSIISILG